MTERAILPLLFCLLLAGSSQASDTATHVVTDFESTDARGLVKAYANEVTKVEAGHGGHASAEFASRLRSGQYVSLRDFFACSELIAMNDRRGSARSGAAAYAQAGAFFEFLLRGPFGEGRADLIPALAALRETGAPRVPAIEKVVGKSVAEIEAAWLAWGRKPPKQ